MAIKGSSTSCSQISNSVNSKYCGPFLNPSLQGANVPICGKLAQMIWTMVFRTEIEHRSNIQVVVGLTPSKKRFQTCSIFAHVSNHSFYFVVIKNDSPEEKYRTHITELGRERLGADPIKKFQRKI